MNEITSKRKLHISDATFVIGMILCAGLVFYKCRIGSGGYDENSYVAMIYRFIKGDAMLLQEWHLTQLSAFTLIPLLQVTLLFLDGTSGIILGFRYATTVVYVLTAIFVYYRLRKEYGIGAAFACMSFMLFSPAGINSFNYDTTGIVGLTITLAILATMQNKKELQLAIAGFFFAVAVLGTPALLLWYVVIGVAAILNKKSKRNLQLSIADFREYLWFTLGAAILAVIMFAFIFSRCSVPQLLAAIEGLTMDDTHSYGVFAILKRYFGMVYLLPPIAVVALSWFDKNEKKHQKFYLLLALLASMATVLYYTVIKEENNYLLMPLMCVGYFMFIHEKDRFIKMFHTYWLWGLAYAVCITIISNTGRYAFTFACCVSVFGTLCMMGEKLQNDTQCDRVIAIGFLAAIVIQLGCQAFMRYTVVFRNDHPNMQTHLIEQGPQAGIYVRIEEAYRYNGYYSDLQQVLEKKGSMKIMTFSYVEHWMYLLGDNVEDCDCASYPMGRGDMSELNINMYSLYYELNPEKTPDVIYVAYRDEEKSQWINKLFPEYKRVDYHYGYILEK